MNARFAALVFSAAVMAAAPGCMVGPATELNGALAQNRALAAQNRAQLTEIENLKAHARDVEDKLIRDEDRLARLQQGTDADTKTY